MSIKNILGNRFSMEDRFIADYDVLGDTVSTLKKSGHKIAMTQGTWDMFHPGHVLYLVRAKEDENADILVAVVDTDTLTRKRKGKARPFDVLNERVIVTAGQRAVDIITVKYTEDHPHKIIEVVKPDVLVVSQRVEDVKEEDLNRFRELCGKVLYLPGQSSVSTTAKMRRVRKEGAEILANRLKATVDQFVKEFLEDTSEQEIEAQLSGNPCCEEGEELEKVFEFIKDWNHRRNGNV